MTDAQGLQEFPCDYTFKIFGRSGGTLLETVRTVISRTIGPPTEDSVSVRESARGRYHSVTVNVRVANRAQLETVYEDLRAEDEVLYFL